VQLVMLDLSIHLPKKFQQPICKTKLASLSDHQLRQLALPVKVQFLQTPA